MRILNINVHFPNFGFLKDLHIHSLKTCRIGVGKCYRHLADGAIKVLKFQWLAQGPTASKCYRQNLIIWLQTQHSFLTYVPFEEAENSRSTSTVRFQGVTYQSFLSWFSDWGPDWSNWMDYQKHHRIFFSLSALK